MISHVTVIVTAANVAAARQIATECDPHGVGMFVTGLSASGLAPITHYISSGYITEPPFISALSDGTVLHSLAVAGAQTQGIAQTSTLQQALDLVAGSIVHTGTNPVTGNPETVFELLSRIGLQLVAGTI